MQTAGNICPDAPGEQGSNEFGLGKYKITTANSPPATRVSVPHPLLCRVSFAHEGRQLQHRGLIVFSGPMAYALRKSRAQALRALRQELCAVQAKIGQPHYRTVKSVQ